MGLNIGIEVKKQSLGFGGSDPNPSMVNLEDDFFEFLRSKFPKAKDCFGGGWVSLDNEGVYDFDVRMFGWGSDFRNNGYDLREMYLAITEFIYNKFHLYENLKMEVYYSG